MRYRWVIGALFFGAIYGTMLFSYSLGMMLPEMTKELGLTPLQVGWLGSAAWLISAALSIPLGVWLSGYSPKRLMALALFIGGLSLLLQGWARNFVTLLVGRLAMSAVLVARSPSQTLLIQQWFPRQEIPFVNGLNSAFSGTGVITALALTPLLLILFSGWRSIFFATALIFFLLALAWLVFGRERITPEYRARLASQERSPIAAPLRYKELWILGLGEVGCFATWTGRIVFWPIYALESYAMPLPLIGIIMAIHEVGYILSALVSGYLSSRLRQRRIFVWAPGIAMPFLAFSLLITDSVPLLILLSFLNGFTWTFQPIVYTVPFDLPGVKPREVAVATAFLSTFMTVGSALGPLMIGAIYQGTGSLFMALAISCIPPLGMALAAPSVPEARPRPVAEGGLVP
ncbi:MAG: MFS transporter [Chloroflexi bacterium]|nr:MFS transporter [Chloroflexota bacterium]